MATTIRSRSRRGREEAWFFVPLDKSRNEIRLSLAADGDAEVGCWVRSSLPGVSNTVIDNPGEPLLPILPAGYRQQYWPVLGMQKISP